METDELEAHLLGRKRELTAELERLTEVPDETTAVAFGKRIGDGTTEAVERLSTTAAAMSISSSLRGIERVLAKLEDGTYGRCDDCGEAIPPERLEARPITSTCVRCQARQDQSGSRR
jgi:DnaK suppressor protein